MKLALVEDCGVLVLILESWNIVLGLDLLVNPLLLQLVLAFREDDHDLVLLVKVEVAVKGVLFQADPYLLYLNGNGRYIQHLA